MKQLFRSSFLLLLGTLVGLSQAFAQTATKVGATVAAGDFYLWNIGAGNFLSQGSSWGTHATVDGGGQCISITGSTNAWHLHFAKVSNASASLSNDGWVDATSDRDTYTSWAFEPVSVQGYTNAYRLKANKGGNYLYWNGGAEDYGNEVVGGALDGKTTQAYWLLVPKAEREGYLTATSTNPVDMTYRLANPDFEGNCTEVEVGTTPDGTGKLTQWLPDGWLDDGFFKQANGAATTVARFVERWAGWWTVSADIGNWPKPIGTYDAANDRYYVTDATIRQTISNLPAGHFRLSLTGGATQQADESLPVSGVHLFAGSKRVPLSGIGTHTIHFVTDGLHSVEVGCQIAQSNANWVYLDHIRLTYLGPVAAPLPNDGTTELAPGQWYYYDAPAVGQYALEGLIDNIIYTPNADHLTDAQPAAKPTRPTLVLDAGRVYFQATTTGTTLRIAPAAGEGTLATFTAATLNVDGLPASISLVNINPDGPGADGTTLISKYLKAKGYDIVAVQEDFSYNTQLLSQLNGTYGHGTWRGTVGATALVSPADTDGQNFLWNTAKGRSATGESWTRFGTTAKTDGNQYIQKGYRYYEVTLAEGLTIDVYTTHMDAGSNDDAIGSKNEQLTQIARAIIASPNTTRPKLFLGDTNCRYTREQVVANLINPINATGTYTMHDVWIEQERGGTYPAVGDATLSSEVVDKIFYINPTAANAARLTPQQYWRETDYTYGSVNGSADHTPLGDHAPVVVRFQAYQPAGQYAAVQERWTWKGEAVSYGAENWYLMNVHFGAGSPSKQGFLAADGTLTANPNAATVHPFALWGDGAGASISNSYSKLRLRYSAADYKADVIAASESGATTFKVFDTSDAESDPSYALTADRAYHFKASSHFFGANSPTELDAHANPSVQNAWALVSDAQRATYNRYCAAWDKGLMYHTLLPLTDATKQAMQALLQKTGVCWTDGTAEALEALNAQIEAGFSHDHTAEVSNHSFELDAEGNPLTTTDEYANHLVPGWAVPNDADEAFISHKDKGGDGWSRYFDGADGNYVFNTFGGNPSGGFYCRQAIDGLPEGFYKLTATACSDRGNTIALKLGSTTAVRAFSAGRPASEQLEVPVHYHNGEGELLVEASSGTWFEIDNFRLLRYSKPFIKGDVNDDGIVDVSDYIGVANYILGSVPQVFIFEAADVNDDGIVDVSDYIGVANIILGGNDLHWNGGGEDYGAEAAAPAPGKALCPDSAD